MRAGWVATICLSVLTLVIAGYGHRAGTVQAAELDYQKDPGKKWRTGEVVTVDQLLGSDAYSLEAPALSSFGGLQNKQFKATGFFYVRGISSRWWLIDPEGHPMVRMGLNSVYRKTRGNSLDALPPKLRDYVTADGGQKWASDAKETLAGLGFNGLGRWSEFELINQSQSKLPYTNSVSFMGAFGRKLGITYAKYGHTGYREDCIPVFHPDFPEFCDDYARKKAGSLKDDPYLLGHYTDNELPVNRELLAITLGLDPDDAELKYNYQAAWDWFRKRRGRNATIEDISPRDGEAYLGYVYERYYDITSAALRKHDPNHLILGSRLHGAALSIEAIQRAAGKHLDIVSFNTYNRLELSRELMRSWEKNTRRPFMVSEFCIKGEDSGLDNKDGAGWVVRTQEDRGIWYQNFVISMLRSRYCVGWDYFKYRDDEDVNKGILSVVFEPYAEFGSAVKRTHESAYAIIGKLDGVQRP